MKQLLPYVHIGFYQNKRCMVVIDDYALFDFIDDYLTEECALPYECVAFLPRPGGEIVTMYFPASLSPEAIEQCLLELPISQIVRIYASNN